MSDVNVSLEPHLLETLRPLPPLLPEPLASQLNSVLAIPAPLQTQGGSDSKRLIPYSLLLSISRWSHSPSGQEALETCEPPLSPTQYSVVALLAGTLTSPERSFPAPALNNSHEVARSKELGDRRAITALLNALLSIIGSGIATWWAADRLQWRAEWRVLLALFVATVVAISEAALYCIWSFYRSSENGGRRKPTRAALQTSPSPSSSSPDTSGVRDGPQWTAPSDTITGRKWSAQQEVRQRRTKSRTAVE
ncbi:hypothetical protein OBBRIDRAFT_796263 [Obba rivulosa]|uniref:Uncharacterized protein n=1 Tax=Obba rivulosa TaxID=1052685 RepID=A0A8E2ANC6_9APHY|nr:hypothetical protein OBBRIDRAFT_796263 [Obba rivulosa]